MLYHSVCSTQWEIVLFHLAEWFQTRGRPVQSVQLSLWPYSTYRMSDDAVWSISEVSIFSSLVLRLKGIGLKLS